MYLGWDSTCVFQLTNSSISWFITSIFWKHLILVAEYVIVNIIPFWTLSEISSKDWIYKRYLKGSSYILKVSQPLVMLINIYIPYFSVFESYTNKVDYYWFSNSCETVNCSWEGELRTWTTKISPLLQQQFPLYPAETKMVASWK